MAKKEKSKRAAKKGAQQFLDDGDGGSLAPPSIPAIDAAAEAARKQKSKCDKANEELVGLKVALSDVMEKNREKIGPGLEYIYEDDANVRRFVKFSKQRVVMGKVKKQKASTKADAHGIVSGASAAETAL